MSPRLAPELTQIAPDAFVAQNAVVLGDVHVAAHATVWFGAVIRGDVEAIRIGARSNVQDLTMIHADAGFPCLVGEGVTIGHRCILHGCRVGDGALIGMGAIVMNGAEVGERSIIGAGALVPEGKKYPARSLIIGAPARVKRELTDSEVELLEGSAAHYVEYGAAFQKAGYGRS